MAFTAPPAYQALPNQEPNTEPLGETTAQPARGTISPGAAPLSPPPAAQQASSQDSKSADTSVSQSAPVQYTAVCAQIGGAGYQFPVVALAQQAPYGGPHDFIVPALVVAIICGFLNILSVAFGISAIIFAVLSMNNKNSNNYPRAKIYAKYALFMIICDIVFTLLIGVFATGFTIACRYGCPGN